MTEPQGVQMTIFDLAGWCGKTLRGPLVRESQRAAISDASLKKQPKWQTGMPIFLNLRGGGGHKPDVSWETDGRLLGEYMMLNFGECRNVEKGYVLSLISTGTQPERYSLNCGEKPLNPIPTKLSDILEQNPDPKYNLSPKACQGILRRAEKRGKVLPPMLDQALRRQAGVSMDGISSQSVSSQKTESQNPCTQESAEVVVENPMLCSQEQSVFKNEPENLGGARESSYNTTESEPCQRSIINPSSPKNGGATSKLSIVCKATALTGQTRQAATAEAGERMNPIH